MDSTLATPEWQTFTEHYWPVKAVPFEYAPRGPNGPMLRVVCYLNRKGRLVLPPYQPHLPLEFKPTPTDAPYRLQRQWLEIARLFVDDMISYGIRGEMTFSPVVTDPRPWLWSWFRVSPRFTDFINFPFAIDDTDYRVQQLANKAQQAGFVCRIVSHLPDVMVCLRGSEQRRGLTHAMTLQGLEMARELLGPEAFRAYVCYAPGGEPATGRIVLHRPGGRACDWLAGTVEKHLHSGATQLLIWHMFNDLQEATAIGYNSCGADRKTVAHAKTMWGGRLMTQYNVRAYDFPCMKHQLGNMLQYLKRQAAVRKVKKR
ncbi:MAG: hypothetical protein JW829_03215 [Pirellulales bacterium]|nr:hypothetical protein [Pirellulales bacterium]